MNAEVYAEWLRRRGERVVRTESAYWHGEWPGVFQAFPYHRLIEPSPAELRELAFRHHAIALRYSAPACAEKETRGYHVVCTKDRYELEALGAWARKNVRRGLRLCEVRRIPLERYLVEGWELRVDTLARQQRRVDESKAQWQARYASSAGLPGFEVWAALVQGRLAATLFTFEMDAWCYMLYQQCHRDFLREHANNALGFRVTQEMIRRPQIRGVFYGMRSLDAPASVDEFKLRMGYEARPVNELVVLHPLLGPLANTFSHRLLRVGLAWRPESRLLSKAEGMLRFYLSDGRAAPTAGSAAAARR